MRPWLCNLVRQHGSALPVFTPDEIYLSCPDCGSRSPGWTLKGSRATDTPGDEEFSEFQWRRDELGFTKGAPRGFERERKVERGARNPLGFDRPL